MNPAKGRFTMTAISPWPMSGTRLMLLLALLAAPRPLSADTIYVMGPTSRSEINDVISNLSQLGHSVTQGDPVADYSAYGQVWDLRFSSDIVEDERNAFQAYLLAGGVMYLSGENGAFDFNRNNDINLFLNQLGLGSVSLLNNTAGDTSQVFTAFGQAFNSPNDIAMLNLYFAREVVPPASGHLVSETSAGSGIGSLIAWDIGDIASAPNARLIIGYDIEIFGGRNPGIVENITTFVPEATSLTLLSLGGLVLVCRRNRQTSPLWPPH